MNGNEMVKANLFWIKSAHGGIQSFRKFRRFSEKEKSQLSESLSPR